MMKLTYNCLIVDDEAPARKLLTEYVQKIPNLNCVGVLTNAIDTQVALRETPIDLLFLDIQMPDLTGLDLLKHLSEPKPTVILTTAYAEYAVASYQFLVADYLLKPITFERFFQAVNRVMALQPPVQPEKEVRTNHIFVKSEQKIVKIDLDQILYLESLREYVSIFTTTGRVVTLQSLSRFLEMLPSERFIRVHRSYIVHLDKIQSIENNMIRIGKAEIIISKSQKQVFLNFINKDMLF
jgi:two-component system, LytTR family, response regulator